VILFAGKVAEVDDEKNVIRSCWDVSAANCTAKLYNIREVTPGLIALAAVSVSVLSDNFLLLLMRNTVKGLETFATS
jgi:hypothetical protein